MLQGLYRFLVQKRYLWSNPWDHPDAPASGAHVEHHVCRRGAPFSVMALQRLTTALADLPAHSTSLRLRVAVLLLQTSVISLQETVAATVDDLQYLPGTPCWYLHVRRKRTGVTRVELPVQLIDRLKSYFLHRGLDHDLTSPRNRGAWLIGRAADALEHAPWAPCAQLPFDPTLGIAPGTLRNQLRDLFQSCARASKDTAGLAEEFSHATARSLHPRGTRELPGRRIRQG
ncbi:MAG: hypothetical protein NVSMB6_10200 [Burkholderiaceae bacterium]